MKLKIVCIELKLTKQYEKSEMFDNVKWPDYQIRETNILSCSWNSVGKLVS